VFFARPPVFFDDKRFNSALFALFQAFCAFVLSLMTTAISESGISNRFERLQQSPVIFEPRPEIKMPIFI
jgi:hypothetical protein